MPGQKPKHHDSSNYRSVKKNKGQTDIAKSFSKTMQYMCHVKENRCKI